MQEQKNIIRKELLARRKAISTPEVINRSQIICQRVFTEVNWEEVLTVCTYEASPGLGEIDTAPLVSLLAGLPNPPTITIVEAHSKAPFPVGNFDVIIVPVLGFDETKHRLGQGGGWYDRFLATQPQATTVGLAHAQFKTTFPHEPHDIPLNSIITERK